MPPSDVSVRDAVDASRLEIAVDGDLAFLEYLRAGTTFVIKHTEVPEALGGRGLGSALVEAARRIAREEERTLISVCPFAQAYLQSHP